MWRPSADQRTSGQRDDLQPDQEKRLPLGREQLYSPSKRAFACNYRSFGFLAVLVPARRAYQRFREVAFSGNKVIPNFLLNSIEAMSGMSEGPRELLVSTAKSDVGVAVSVWIQVRRIDIPKCRTVGRVSLHYQARRLGVESSICRSILEAHGGSLWTSTNEPWGVEFSIHTT
jgi:hypothetical protein